MVNSSACFHFLFSSRAGTCFDWCPFLVFLSTLLTHVSTCDSVRQTNKELTTCKGYKCLECIRHNYDGLGIAVMELVDKAGKNFSGS